MQTHNCSSHARAISQRWNNVRALHDSTSSTYFNWFTIICMQEMNEQSNKTWSANTSYNDTGRMTSPTSTMTRQSRNKRPSLFDAFDIERPATASAQRAAAKHKNIYDAFGVTDNQSSLNKDSGASLGTRHNSSSPQSTWTAGMTRGTMPAELRQALQNQNRASDSPKDRSIGRPNSDPAALRRQHSDPSSSHPLDVLNQRLSQPGQDEASTSLGYKDGNTLMSDSGGGPSSGDYQDFNDLTSTHTAVSLHLHIVQCMPSLGLVVFFCTTLTAHEFMDADTAREIEVLHPQHFCRLHGVCSKHCLTDGLVF